MHNLKKHILFVVLLCLLPQVADAQTITKAEANHGTNGIHTASLNYYLEHLSQPSSKNRHIISLEAGYSLAPDNLDFKATFIPRLNSGQYTSSGTKYFENSNLQYQLESYMTFSPKINLVSSYAYSSSTFFAKHFATLEATYKVGQSWGVIGGAKMMYWDSATTTYTLGAEKYVGNYWITLKPSLIIQGGKSFGGLNAGIRRYLNDPLNFIHAGLSYGNSPEYSNLNPDFRNLLSFSSFGGHLLLQHRLYKNMYVRPAISFRREEYAASKWRTVWGGNIGLSCRF